MNKEVRSWFWITVSAVPVVFGLPVLIYEKTHPYPAHTIEVGDGYVTNLVIFTNPPVETEFQQGLRVGSEIGFKDGVFWGSFACFRGNPTNMVDAETIAYRMRREAISDWEAHKRAMTNQ